MKLEKTLQKEAVYNFLKEKEQEGSLTNSEKSANEYQKITEI